MYIRGRPGGGLGGQTTTRDPGKAYSLPGHRNPSNSTTTGLGFYLHRKGPNQYKLSASLVRFNPFKLTRAMAPRLSPFLRTSAVTKPRHRVNSFISFLWGSRGEDHDENVEVALICIIVDLTKSPYCRVFSCLLNACRFQLSPMHVHYYYYSHRSVVQVKGNNDDI